MWWDLQNEKRKQAVKNLVYNGQIEFVNGGYGASDEACPTYDHIIENFKIGRQWIAETFGEKTAQKFLKVGW